MSTNSMPGIGKSLNWRRAERSSILRLEREAAVVEGVPGTATVLEASSEDDSGVEMELMVRERREREGTSRRRPAVCTSSCRDTRCSDAGVR